MIILKMLSVINQRDYEDDKTDLMNNLIILESDYWYGFKSTVECIKKLNLSPYQKKIFNNQIKRQTYNQIAQLSDHEFIIDYIVFFLGTSFFDIKQKTNVRQWYEL